MRIRLPVIVLAVAASLPAITWATFKPIRVLAPQWVGLTCTGENVCVDDVSKLPDALALRKEALSFVATRVDRIGTVPRFVFCSQQPCAQSFGFSPYQGAYHVGTSGVVIGPLGWRPFFVRHELIHHVQMENIGSMHALLFTPTWFIEGMAYSLSEDPRRPLPEPLEGWRNHFEAWYPTQQKKEEFWGVARALRP
ncbi:hypothetical protein [Variovorax sp. RB3P1]|uniref:hypothetical protein n=1 Tax=Variovorax sp. RB3P1 TaxID=3443732 RepID=UPI003F495E31